MKRLPKHATMLLLALALALPLTVAIAIALMPAPQLVLDLGGDRAAVRSDRAWTLLPGDCLNLSWEIDSERGLSIAGGERVGRGESQFCPRVFAPSPVIAWRDPASGVQRNQRLDNHHLPDYLVNLLGLLSFGACGVALLLILWRGKPDERFDWRLWLAAVLLLALLIALSRFATRAVTIVGFLSITRGLALTLQWQIAGALLLALLYAALAIGALRQGIIARRLTDFLALGGCMLFIALLYAPFGFGTVGHWEEWIAQAWLEGMSFQPWDSQITGRVWLLVSRAAGWLLTPDSFHGMNLVYAATLFITLACFYGSLRLLGVGAFIAFLLTMLMAAYPVNKNLMSLRSLHPGGHVALLMTAMFLMLRYRATASRLHLALCWLALALGVGLYETGFGLILITPLLWLRDRRTIWRRVNLTLAWLIIPLLKVLYLALILLSGRGFYRSWSLADGGENAILDRVVLVVENLAIVLNETFIRGWSEALHALSRTQWLPWSALTLIMIGLVAGMLRRGQRAQSLPPPTQLRRWLLYGSLLLLPAVIVLIGFEGYSRNGWQIYLFVPFGAAFVVFSLAGLLAHRLGNGGVRDATLLILCLLLLLPGITRLYWQHDDFVKRADFKARILEQIVQLAPGMQPQTRFVVVSDLKPDDHWRFHIYEMKSAMLGAAVYVLHDGVTSGIGTICYPPQDCAPFRDWESQLADTLVFWLDADFQLSLIAEPAVLDAAFAGIDYDAARLYDRAAPIPPRAYTMLGMTR